MRFRFWAVVVIATMAMLACGGSSGSDPTEAGLQNRAESQTEAGLRIRAESQAKAQSDGKWAEWYKFFSPGNKSSCTEADFSAAVTLSMSMFRESKGLEESDELEFRVQEVTVQGTQGLVVVDMYFDGELLFDSPNENWVFADGDWWSVNSGGPDCWAATPTLVPSGTSNDPFDEVDMRALLSDEEVEAAIPLVIGNKLPITDMRGLAGEEGMAGIDSIWGHLFPAADAGGRLMVIVTDFESTEILQQQIVVWTARDSLEFTGATIGDGSLQGQEGGTISVRFWKGDKTVLLNATGLPGTQEVLDGLIELAELAASRLSSG